MGEPASALGVNRIRLRHLQCAVAIAQFGSLRGAADSLSVTQPAITKTLNELESLLGMRLFERGRQGAVPTPASADFMRHARASLAALQKAMGSVTAAREEAPLLRVGALPTVAPALLPAVLKTFAAAWPRATVRVLTGFNASLLQQLQHRELDLVIGRLAEPQSMTGLGFELLFVEPLVVVGRPAHPLLFEAATSSGAGQAARAAIDAAIARFPWLLPPAGTVIRHSADSFIAGRGWLPQAGVTETLSVSLARELVRGGDALWVTPRSAVEADLRRGSLRTLPLDTTGTEEPVGLLLHTDQVLEGALRVLVEALRQAAASRRAGTATKQNPSP